MFPGLEISRGRKIACENWLPQRPPASKDILITVDGQVMLKENFFFFLVVWEEERREKKEKKREKR